MQKLKIFSIKPLRAICILDYLIYLQEQDLCGFVEANKDGINKYEWDITQMYINNNKYNIKELKDKLYNNYKTYGNIEFGNN